jgi:hypothetical protein
VLHVLFHPPVFCKVTDASAPPFSLEGSERLDICKRLK